MAKKKYYEKNPDEQAQHEEFEESEGGSGSNIKIETVLLAIIAVALVVQTFIMISGSGESDTPAYVPSNNNQPAAMNQPQQQQPRMQQQQPQAQQPQAQQPQIQMNPQQQTPQQQQPPASDPNATTANYSETTHDFGAVSPSDGNLTHTFTVTNAGDKPLSYSNVRGDAGVTVTKYPTQPVPPGGKGEITVQFNPNQAKGEGNQAYNVHMDANTNPGHQHLVIQATVNK